mmetsp:Transcript_91355/g.242653  ORF Transcript_91355/g.242653 Transcript_91355/m.242653 type:complete len:365 (-) Transcript_91355:13-1107(-)
MLRRRQRQLLPCEAGGEQACRTRTSCPIVQPALHQVAEPPDGLCEHFHIVRAQQDLRKVVKGAIDLLQRRCGLPAAQGAHQPGEAPEDLHAAVEAPREAGDLLVEAPEVAHGPRLQEHPVAEPEVLVARDVGQRAEALVAELRPLGDGRRGEDVEDRLDRPGAHHRGRLGAAAGRDVREHPGSLKLHHRRAFSEAFDEHGEASRVDERLGAGLRGAADQAPQPRQSPDRLDWVAPGAGDAVDEARHLARLLGAGPCAPLGAARAHARPRHAARAKESVELRGRGGQLGRLQHRWLRRAVSCRPCRSVLGTPPQTASNPEALAHVLLVHRGRLGVVHCNCRHPPCATRTYVRRLACGRRAIARGA